MGLCKCPKKKVTNLFCFVHKVNVCEHCMIESHSRCIVQTYLKWLEDNDFDPLCAFCSKSLEEGEVIRLVCFDLCHLSCVDRYAHSLPPSTHHHQYKCPQCESALFPPEKLVSPVAEGLRKALSRFPWALEGIGLPPAPAPNFSSVPSEDGPRLGFDLGPQLTSTPYIEGAVHQRPSGEVGPLLDRDYPDGLQPPQGLAQKGTGYAYPERPQDAVVDIVASQDEDKYRKRATSHWLARWLRNQRVFRTVSDEQSGMRRTVILAVLLIVLFCTVIVVLTRVGRSVANDDPLLNPRANPNVRVVDSKFS